MRAREATRARADNAPGSTAGPPAPLRLSPALLLIRRNPPVSLPVSRPRPPFPSYSFEEIPGPPPGSPLFPSSGISPSPARIFLPVSRLPVFPDAALRERALAEAWERLDPKFRLPNQVLGRRSTVGCVALEITQRCNLDCTLCYLSESSESVKDVPLEVLFERASTGSGRRYGRGRERAGHGRGPDAPRARASSSRSCGDIAERGPPPLPLHERHQGDARPARRSSRRPASSTSRSTWTRPRAARRYPTEASLNAVRREYIERARGLGIAVIFNTTVHARQPRGDPRARALLPRPLRRRRDGVLPGAGGDGPRRLAKPGPGSHARARSASASRRASGEGRARVGRRAPRAIPTATRRRCSRRSAAAPSTSSRTRRSTRRFLEETQGRPLRPARRAGGRAPGAPRARSGRP